jgi:hypothetical protein
MDANSGKCLKSKFLEQTLITESAVKSAETHNVLENTLSSKKANLEKI